jgi:hypothetical protein
LELVEPDRAAISQPLKNALEARYVAWAAWRLSRQRRGARHSRACAWRYDGRRGACCASTWPSAIGRFQLRVNLWVDRNSAAAAPRILFSRRGARKGARRARHKAGTGAAALFRRDRSGRLDAPQGADCAALSSTTGRYAAPFPGRHRASCDPTSSGRWVSGAASELLWRPPVVSLGHPTRRAGQCR